MDKFVCIHGHFYQPPRENPWLEAIEHQDSAYPYHDWNERITSECYAPNMASRILDGQARIVEIVNNYSRISFNFGPTLLSWMQEKSRDVYNAILAADKASMKNFSGHGSAMSQAYNHIIMPLANSRDKRTQVIWGLRDFESRFGRKPEGMWLPETAVDIETLELLAEHNVTFTILSPHQAARYRKIGSSEWTQTRDGSIDPSMSYLAKLPSGRQINLFFYDGPVSRAVAFERLLSQGEVFANRLVSSFSPERTHPQLAHIATDGETYGHHHRYGEMALSYALHYISSQGLAHVTNYGEFLSRFPPTYEVEIFENTSWSCAHGVERWRSNCGCNIGTNASWNQSWRAPLREALDWLRDTLAPLFEQRGAELFNDPWLARNDYINVILERSPEQSDQFLSRHAKRSLNAEERIAAIKLMEMQRHALLMYTSCGWFFDDLTNIETVQVIQYAGRALQLAQELFQTPLEEGFLSHLANAQSNIKMLGNGRDVYERSVRPAMVDLQKVGAHYALSSLFEDYGDEAKIYCYRFEREDYLIVPEGKARLALGVVNITSLITGEAQKIIFTAIHLGDHNLSGGTRPYKSDEDYRMLVTELASSFEHADLPAFFRLVDKHFSNGIYTLKALFQDEKRKILSIVLNSTLDEAESAYRHIYEHHAPLMRFLSDINMPLPKAFSMAAEQALNRDLRKALAQEEPDIDRIKEFLEEAKRARIKLDETGLSFVLSKAIERLAEKFKRDPGDVNTLHHLELITGLTQLSDLHADFWKTQNIFYDMMHTYLPNIQSEAQHDKTAQIWVKHFLKLGEKLHVKV